MRKTIGGAALPISVIGSEDFDAYKIGSRVATPVTVVSGRGIVSGRSTLVRPVSDSEIQSGKYRLMGGPAIPVVVEGGDLDGAGAVCLISSAIASSGGAAAFAPSDIAGLASWGIADEIAGNDGDAISSYTDKQGVVWSQATGTKQPLLKTGANGINGHGVVRFDGTDDSLVANSVFVNGGSGAIIMVIRNNVLQENTVLSSADEAVNDKYAFFRSHTAGGFIDLAVREVTSPNSVRGDTVVSADVAYIMVWRSNGSAYSLRINGSEESLTVVAGSNDGFWFSGVTGRDGVALGTLKRVSEANFFEGDIAEWIIYDGVTLSDSEVEDVEAYLSGYTA